MVKQHSIEREEWRAVVGWEGLYEVSSLGRVRTLGRTVPIEFTNQHGTYISLMRTYPRKIMQLSAIYQKGRLKALRLPLSRGDGSGSVQYSIHTLVMGAFVGPKPEGMVVCHNDDNPANNCVSNLRYDTQQGNIDDIHAHGHTCSGERNFARQHPELMPRGSRHGNAKLTELVVLEIRSHFVAGATTGDVAACFGISRSLAYNIKVRKLWTHI